AQEALYDAVLEAMEADYRQPPSGLEQAFCGDQAFLELTELAVDVNADRLETPRGGILRRARAIAQRLADDLSQLTRGRKRPRRDDRTRHAPALTLLAITIEH